MKTKALFEIITVSCAVIGVWQFALWMSQNTEAPPAVEDAFTDDDGVIWPRLV